MKIDQRSSNIISHLDTQYIYIIHNYIAIRQITDENTKMEKWVIMTNIVHNTDSLGSYAINGRINKQYNCIWSIAAAAIFLKIINCDCNEAFIFGGIKWFRVDDVTREMDVFPISIYCKEILCRTTTITIIILFRCYSYNFINNNHKY